MADVSRGLSRQALPSVPGRAALVVWASAIFACGGGASTTGGPPSAADRGSIQVVATGALAGQVQQVVVEVVPQSPGGATTRSGMTLATGQYTAEIADLDAGAYTVKASALAADGTTVLYYGEASASIAPGQTSAVAIVLQQVAPPPSTSNAAPDITSLVASDATPYFGESITLTVTALDDDPGAPLTYAWEATCAGATTTLSAPTSATTGLSSTCAGDLTATAHVSDPLGATATASLVLHYATQGIAASVTLNTWPDVTSIASPGAQVPAGADIPLVATAKDDDGDPLTYAWTSGCGGTFTGGDSPAPTFHTPAVAPVSGSCQLTLTVSDGRGGTTAGDLTVWIQ